MRIKNKEILCIGEVLWDQLPSGRKPGGAPMNVALHLNTFGMDVAIASSVGNDDAGQDLKTFLNKTGISTEYIQTNKHLPTSEVLVHIDINNNATYQICEPVAWDKLIMTESLRIKAKRSGLIIFGSLASRNQQSRETILEVLNSDCVKLMDVNFREPFYSKEQIERLLEKTDILKLNEEELMLFSLWHKKQEFNEEALTSWMSEYYNIPIICITKGKNGALLLYNGEFFKHPGFKVKTVDTVGAGDAFLAGFIASLFKGKEPKTALAFACATGALIASKVGANPKYSIEEIQMVIDHKYS